MEKTSSQKAGEAFRSGCNCCQAVLLPFVKELGLDETAFQNLTSGMGGGMGGLRQKCGAVTGMFLAAGLLFGDFGDDPDAKARCYQIIRQLDERFTQRFGSTCCRELLEQAGVQPGPEPSVRTEAYYAQRPCLKLVEAAAQMVDETFPR